MMRTIVRQFLYPAFLSASFSGSLLDQFGFRPTESTTGALITILHTVTNLLVINPYVCIIALDFSKAFDTVRHSTLLEKIAKLKIPESTIYSKAVRCSYVRPPSVRTFWAGKTIKQPDDGVGYQVGSRSALSPLLQSYSPYAFVLQLTQQMSRSPIVKAALPKRAFHMCAPRLRAVELRRVGSN
jgi:hypothetical protein